MKSSLAAKAIQPIDPTSKRKPNRRLRSTDNGNKLNNKTWMIKHPRVITGGKVNFIVEVYNFFKEKKPLRLPRGEVVKALSGM